MPIQEADPWRVQYFQDVPCPAEVVIPTEDADAWLLYPRQRWVYNKMLIAESQGLLHAPHGAPPPGFPVFSKPIYNFRGMSTGCRVLQDAQDYLLNQQPGHFWMELLTGEHLSTDCAVVAGRPVWWRHATGAALADGMFDHWTVHAAPRPALERALGTWIAANLSGYTGMVNLETIGGHIMEVHLRFADQWPDLYGPGWVTALVRLYAEGVWTFDDDDRRDGYSVVLFGGHGPAYRHPNPDLVAEVRAGPGVSSVQITFHEDRPPTAHAMPTGGFRLAIINCWDLAAGQAARQQLALGFWSTQRLEGAPASLAAHAGTVA